MALTKDTIVREALRLLNEGGLESVSLRKLAARLDVQAPALYWHFKNKAVLTGEMAEAILKEKFPDIPGIEENERWEEGLVRMQTRLREAMLAYTDGGRVVAGAHLSVTMADLMEAAIGALVEAGLDLQEARLVVLAATRYTFGFVIEEQTPPTPEGLDSFDLDAFRQRHPHTVAGIEQYFSAGRTVDDLYADGLRLIVRRPEPPAS
jgi:TetR/AcrR family tetracycline transcriptional repressor